MIVREYPKEFIMIGQHHHAFISGKLFTYLKEHYLPESTWKQDIEYAIFNHDCGWKQFDEMPFWDDEKNAPYSFTSFPKAPKTVLYEHGIKQVEEKSMYASLLCGKHYASFMKKHSTSFAKQFIKREKVRQEQFKKKIQGFNEDQFQLHYELLKFFDDLSLYICLNEPGVEKEKEHPFFRKGISLPATFGGGTLQTHWGSEETIQFDRKLFNGNPTVKLNQKVVSKATIAKNGLQKAYAGAETKTTNITIKSSS